MKAIAARCDRLIVVGAPNSSNSLRLVEVAERAGCPKALLVQQAADIPWDQFEGIATLGITAGASAPELLVTQIIDAFRARFDVSVESVVTRRGAYRLQRAARAARGGRRPALTTPRPALHMAVYTEVSDDELAKFIASYDLGALLSYKGIAEGVENTNYLVHTEKGPFFLTLYEKRVAPNDLPFFLGLMEHLAGPASTAPRRYTTRQGRMLRTLAGRPAALVTFLEGVWIRRPQARHCGALGQAMAGMHLAGRDFGLSRANGLGLSAWRPLYARFCARADEIAPGLAPPSCRSSTIWRPTGRPACRRASSTPTSFPTTPSSSATSSPA